jgi:hypothetical protein
MRRARTLLLAVAALVAVAACSNGSSEIRASDATQKMVEELRLPDSVSPCLEHELDADDASRRALDPEAQPSDAELDALSDVLARCVPAETFAASMSAQMADGYRAVADIPPEKEACLRDEIAALPDDERGLFVTGLVARVHAPDSDRSLAVSRLLERLRTACDVQLGSGPPADGGEPGPGATSLERP